MSEVHPGALPPPGAPPEVVRSAIIAGIDGALGHTWLVPADALAMLKAGRDYWLVAPDIELAEFARLLGRYRR